MQCPVDGATLEMSERQGIEIDYCPQCRGVWLDRGELDKIIERTNKEFDSIERSNKEFDARPPESRREVSWGGQRRKRRSLLEELFD